MATIVPSSIPATADDTETFQRIRAAGRAKQLSIRASVLSIQIAYELAADLNAHGIRVIRIVIFEDQHCHNIAIMPVFATTAAYALQRILVV